MQGSVIPRCYASVQVVPPPSDSEVSQAFVYGLILKDVDGVNLTEIEPSTGDYASLGHSLMASVALFPTYGVLHQDIREGNILISPTRIVILDFGNAVLKKPFMSDEQWRQRVEFESEVDTARFILNHGRIRNMTPICSPLVSADGRPLPPFRIIFFNDTVRQFSKEWARRWYHEAPQAEVEKGTKDHPILEWIIKDDVRAWLKSLPPPPHRFLVPRPGSPESHVPKLAFPLPSA